MKNILLSHLKNSLPPKVVETLHNCLFIGESVKRLCFELRIVFSPEMELQLSSH